MRSTIILFILLFTSGVILAQSGTITGTIKTSDNVPAEFINVGVLGTTKGATTDRKGNFTIKDVKAGAHTIVVSPAGRAAIQKNLTVAEGETATIEIALTESARTLEEVTIKDNANRYNSKTTSSGLRLTTPIHEVPQNIQVVTGKMLKDQQVISMSDGLVRNVSGLVRMEHWGDMYTNISARGAQIQAFRNGFNVVNSYWGPLTEDMSFVETIEFVKGPAGFMLSSGDPAGMYNVVTKKPTGVEKGEVSLTMGSYGLFRGALDLDGKLSKNGKVLYRLNVAGQNKGSFRANEYNDRYTIAPVVSYQLDDKTKVTMEYTYQRANMSNVGSYYVFSPDGYATLPVDFTSLPAGTPGVRIDDHSLYLNMQHNINDNWRVTGQVARFQYYQQGASMWPSKVNPDGTMIRNIGIWDATSNMSMGQIFVNGKATTGAVTHNILGGVDMGNKDYLADWSQSHDLDDSANLFDPKNPNLGVPVTGYPEFDRTKPLAERAQAGYGYQNMTYSSLYVQDELGFFDNKARLTLAGRYTDLKQAYAGPANKAQHFTPRAGLSVSLSEQTAVYALYDQAFVPQSGILTNGDKVQPITGNNTEAGVKKQWDGGRWSSGLTVYRILKNNELIADPTQLPSSGLSIELGQKVSQGVELDVKGTITRNLSIIVNYAYTDSRVLKVAEGVTALKEGDLVPGFSKHTANAWLTYRIQNGALKGFGINCGATYLGDRATYWEAAPDPSITLPNYLKVDGGLSWENDKLRVTANVFNMLNEYLYSGSYYSWVGAYYWQAEAPRNFRVTVGYSF
ncbi:TonB-dependent siderophore receptor [Nemorincola caseinilytica]|uniref:TonB-dependent siderophore receptor n=1 Tax=Nemorincola caseinilytica TaxID=2054315 RepID=A0ABP8NJV4_9BACT